MRDEGARAIVNLGLLVLAAIMVIHHWVFIPLAIAYFVGEANAG